MLFFKIFLCISLVVIAYLSIRTIKYFERKNLIALDKLILDTKIDHSAVEVLDSIIKECLEEYIILHPMDSNITYITTSMEKELIEFVSTNASERISPILVKKLRYKYNEDFIPGLIGSRVYLAVMDYVLSVNIGSSDKK